MLSTIVWGGMEIIGLMSVIVSDEVFRVLYAMIETSLSEFEGDFHDSKGDNAGTYDGYSDLAVFDDRLKKDGRDICDIHFMVSFGDISPWGLITD